MTFSVMIRAAAQRDIENAQDWYLGHAPEHVLKLSPVTLYRVLSAL